MVESHGTNNAPISYVKLKGLMEQAVYEDVKTERQYYGSALMQAGLPLPIELGEYPAYQIELKQVRL